MIIVIMITKAAGFLIIMGLSLLLSSSVGGLFEENDSTGEIITAHANPILLIAGQNEIFDIAIRSQTNKSDFHIEVIRDFQTVASSNLNFNNAGIKVISLKSSLPPSPGESKYTYKLYSGKIAIHKGSVSSLSETRSIYSLRDASDVDNDGLRYFEEIELGTEPALADTDGDSVNDNIDSYPIDESRS